MPNWLKQKVIALLAVLLVTILILIWRPANEYGFICPNEFKTAEEYINDLARWTSEYVQDHPNVNEGEIAQARERFIDKYKCGPAPVSEMDIEELMDYIEYVESQMVDPEADALTKTADKKELLKNPYIQHLRIAFDAYVSGANEGIEEVAEEADQLESGHKCGLNNFDRSFYQKEFTVVRAERNDYGGAVIYITFSNNLDKVFWAWIYKLGTGEYVLRGFCEEVASAET